jgi:hypothetical protein
MPNHSTEKVGTGKMKHIFICTVLDSLQSRLPASSSQVPMGTEVASVEGLLHARHRIGCWVYIHLMPAS